MQYQSQQAPDKSIQTNLAGRFVFPYDAEDLKAHRWFKGVPWDRLHELNPPFVPLIRSPDDTQYFDDEEPITDFSDSDEDDDDDDDRALPRLETSTAVIGDGAAIGRDGANDNTTAVSASHDPTSSVTATPIPEQQPISPEARCPAQEVTPVTAVSAAISSKRRIERNAHLAQALERFDRGIQEAVQSWLSVPYDSIRLRNFEMQVDAEVGLQASERDALKALVRVYGRKEKKRPRDKLLRDPSTKKAVLQERKRSAFLGYDWQRNQILPMFSGLFPTLVRDTRTWIGSSLPPGLCASVTTGIGLVGDDSGPRGDGGILWPDVPPGHENSDAMGLLHRRGLSMN